MVVVIVIEVLVVLDVVVVLVMVVVVEPAGRLATTAQAPCMAERCMRHLVC